MVDVLTGIHGRKFGLGYQNQLISEGIEITRPCVDATVTVSDETDNVRTVTIQLKDANGKDIDYVESVMIVLYGDANRTSYTTTGGSTGLAAGTDGALLALVAKKVFIATSESDGDIDLSYTDTGSDVAFIGVHLPNGRVVMGSQALTNAA